MEPEPSPRDAGNMAMAGMCGIERSAEQAHARSPPVTERGDQGRTWPLPVTR
jgi:hypothetical protein